jgi:hypothetical protein
MEREKGMWITEGACLAILEVNVILDNIKSTFGQPTDGFLRVRGKVGKLYRDFPVTEEHWWNGISSFVLTDLPSSQEKFDPMEDPDDTPGIISVDDIDFEYLSTEVHLDDVSGKPNYGRAHFLSVEIEVSENIAEEEGEFNKLDGLLYGKSRSEKFIRLGEIQNVGLSSSGNTRFFDRTRLNLSLIGTLELSRPEGAVGIIWGVYRYNSKE